MSTLQRLNYSQLGEAVGPYSHAVIHQKVLYTSGLTAYGSDAQHKEIVAQTKEIFTQLSHICQSHQVALDHLIKVTIFITDMRDVAQLRSALFELYGENFPASTLIKVDSLFSQELLIEVEATIGL